MPLRCWDSLLRQHNLTHPDQDMGKQSKNTNSDASDNTADCKNFIFFLCIRMIYIFSLLRSKCHKFIYLFIYFWLHWVFIAAYGLSLVAEIRGYSLLRCSGFSLRWLLLLWSTGSRCVGFSSCLTAGFSSCGMWTLERRLSSCGERD